MLDSMMMYLCGSVAVAHAGFISQAGGHAQLSLLLAPLEAALPPLEYDGVILHSSWANSSASLAGELRFDQCVWKGSTLACKHTYGGGAHLHLVVSLHHGEQPPWNACSHTQLPVWPRGCRAVLTHTHTTHT